VRKIRELHDNSNFFRNSLRAMGCEVLGDEDSPVMPLMLYQPAKIAAFSRECLKRNVAVVVVGFPATPLLLGRTRVCISASHSLEDLEAALEVFRDVVDLLVRTCSRHFVWN
jgi:serine palmitoyltransferase